MSLGKQYSPPPLFQPKTHFLTSSLMWKHFGEQCLFFGFLFGHCCFSFFQSHIVLLSYLSSGRFSYIPYIIMNTFSTLARGEPTSLYREMGDSVQIACRLGKPVCLE